MTQRSSQGRAAAALLLGSGQAREPGDGSLRTAYPPAISGTLRQRGLASARCSAGRSLRESSRNRRRELSPERHHGRTVAAARAGGAFSWITSTSPDLASGASAILNSILTGPRLRAPACAASRPGSRPIVSHTPTSSGSRPHHRENFTDVNVDREIDDAQTNPLTAGPSISADLNYGRLLGYRSALVIFRGMCAVSPNRLSFSLFSCLARSFGDTRGRTHPPQFLTGSPSPDLSFSRGCV